MPFMPRPARLRLPHQHAAAWPTDLLTFEEAERHLRRLTRIAGCGCMRYLNFRSRGRARVWLPNGVIRETPVARIMATLSADRPLGPTDYACHRCDVEECCNPDHLYAGTASSNMHDKYRRGRPIRERCAARFYDEILLEIGGKTPSPHTLSVQKARPSLLAAPMKVRMMEAA